MADTTQIDLQGNKAPDVSMEEETKLFSVYRTKHLKLTVEKDVLDKQVEKRKISVSDKARRIKAWIQSKARMIGSKDGLVEGTWDKETKQLCDEIMQE